MKSIRFLHVDNHKIYVEIINEAWISQKTALVLLHEGLGSTGQWKDFPYRLAEILQVPVILYDRIGYGKSSPVNNRNTLYMEKEAREYLPALLTQLGISEPVNIFGHSDGATIALLFAAFNPGKVKKVIAEAPHVIIEDISVQGIKGAIWAFQHRDLKQRLSRYHGENTEDMFWSWANFWTLDSSRDWNMLKELEQIVCPVCFVQGSDDNFGTLEQGQVIRKKIQGSYTELVLANCGHVPHLEKKDQVLTKCVEYFT